MRDMEKIKLPGIDLAVSKICLGCAYLGSREEEDTAFALLDTYYDYGGRFFNTAHAYGGGKSEQCLGKWINKRGIREQVVITSKCGQENFVPVMHAENLLKHIDGTLMFTGFDYVDFYLLHQDDLSVPVGEIMDALSEMKKKGKIRYYGCSNWSVERQKEAAAYADEHGLSRFAVDEIEMSVAHSNLVNDKNESLIKWLDESYISYHKESGMAVGAYSPTTGGTLAKYLRDGGIQNWNEWHLRVYDNSYNYEVARRLGSLSKETGYSPVQLQLAWLIAQPYDFVCFPIIGPRTIEQLKDSMGALDVPMTREMIEFLKPQEV